MRYFRLLRTLVRLGVIYGGIIGLIYSALGVSFFYILSFPQGPSTNWNHIMPQINQAFSSPPIQPLVQLTAPTASVFEILLFGYIILHMGMGGLKEQEIDEVISKVQKLLTWKLYYPKSYIGIQICYYGSAFYDRVVDSITICLGQRILD